jgi:hypothetical protein
MFIRVIDPHLTISMIRPHCLVPSDFMPLNALRISDCSASSQMPILACLLVFLTQNSFNSCLEIHRLLNTLGILDCLIFTLLAVACPFFLAFLFILLMQDSFNSCLQIYRHPRSWDIGNAQAWWHWVHTLHHIMSEAGDTTMCMSCGGEFPLGPGDPCTKCRKIKAAGSESEREAVILMPQCNGCGCAFPYLKDSQCGSCAKKIEASNERQRQLECSSNS